LAEGRCKQFVCFLYKLVVTSENGIGEYLCEPEGYPNNGVEPEAVHVGAFLADMGDG
jgi:hypothetical protein